MPDASTSRQLVVFSLGEEEYALPIGSVQEILFYSPPRAVASGASWITGVISLRGKIVAVYDLASRLGMAHEQAENAKIVIVEAGDERAGVIVDDVTEVLTVDDEHLETLPAAAEDELIESVAKVGDRLVVLLDLDRLIAPGRSDAVVPTADLAPVAA